MGGRDWNTDSQRDTFEVWLSKVSRHTVKACGLEAEDLPDFAWADTFETGCNPRDAARYALEDLEYLGRY